VTTPSSTTTEPASTEPASTAPARFLLLGDSHAGPVGRAARAAGIPFSGGPIGSGRDFNVGFYDLRGSDPVFREAEIDQLYRGFLAELGISGLGDLEVPLVLTFGLGAHYLATAENWQLYRTRSGAFVPGFISGPLFASIVTAMTRDALAFYQHALGLGLRVLALLPPQRVPVMSDPEVFLAAQETVRQALTALGVEVVDLRDLVTDASGFQRPELCEADDPIHGNLAFGRLILADLIDRGL
jgi:hypothetical protein